MTRHLLVALIWAISSPLTAQEPFHYDLRATLRPDAHVVEGAATIRWTNTSSEATSELLFHLYLNAFADDRSVFMQESGGQLRGDEFQGAGSIEVEALHWGEHDLLRDADTELVEGDRSQLRVRLPATVEPGESISLETTFRSILPPVFARSGYAGDFHMVAQWFPKLARLESDGTWASFPYHAHGEFYADFARYELEVRTPIGWVVGATGAGPPPATDGDESVHSFVAERVHDCAFAAAPWFIERQDDWTIEGQSIHVRALSPPGAAAAAREHLRTTRLALERYARLYGEYPYETLTVIVPPADAPGAAGMEYPTLFVTAGPWWTSDGLPFRAPIAMQAHVTAHELGHQWFQGLVASNEVEWPMLDEGLTEWITCDFLTAQRGRASAVSLPFANIPIFETERIFGFGGAPSPPPGRPAHAFHGAEYGQSVYAKSTAIFETVARVWGRRRFHRALGHYARRHRFSHPTPDDLFRSMDAEYGSWMSRKILRPALLHGGQAVHRVGVVPSEDGWTVEARRFGGLPIPTWIHVTKANGDDEVHLWPAHDTELTLRFTERPIRVHADAHRHNMTDPERRDDGVDEESRGYFARALWVVQSILSSWVGP